jgi:hypothetical protein
MTDDEMPIFVLAASDPAAPFALLAYASALRNKGGSDEDVAEIKEMVQEWYKWQDTHGVIPLGRSVMLSRKIDALFKGHNDTTE